MCVCDGEEGGGGNGGGKGGWGHSIFNHCEWCFDVATGNGL